jgi:hypothetical protein
MIAPIPAPIKVPIPGAIAVPIAAPAAAVPTTFRPRTTLLMCFGGTVCTSIVANKIPIPAGMRTPHKPNPDNASIIPSFIVDYKYKILRLTLLLFFLLISAILYFVSSLSIGYLTRNITKTTNINIHMP